MSFNLFRQKALDNKKTPLYGSVLLNSPVSYLLLTGGLSVLMIALSVFFLWGQFTEQFTVKGYINSSKGMVGIYTIKPGVIQKSLVSQGQHVRKRDPLFLIDTSLYPIDSSDDKDILGHLKERKAAIIFEMKNKKKELSNLRPLLEKHYISDVFYHNKLKEMMTLKENKNLIELEEIRFRQSQSYIIRAPITGVISSVISFQGQYVNSAKPLAKLLPDHSSLIAELFVPIRQAGFLKKNTSIKIQLDAYPFMRFGAVGAHIFEISDSILTDHDEDKPFLMKEPYYKVKAKLDKQTINVFKSEQRIQHGMTLLAVVMGPKKKIWQWAFDPLYSY